MNSRLSRLGWGVLALSVLVCAGAEGNDLLMLSNVNPPGLLRYNGSTGNSWGSLATSALEGQ